MRRIILFLVIASFVAAPSRLSRVEGEAPTSSALTLPLKDGSVRFAVIGDFGTGERAQYELAQQMEKYHGIFPFDFVVLLGDNIYGGHRPSDFEHKFEQPYKTLLDAGVKFYASLGNHDNPDERFYKPFNMGGERYYEFKKGGVAFFALDSNYMSPQQLQWLEQNLKNAGSGWKICFFHHPLYSDGKSHGPDLDLRAHLEPLFQKYGVDTVLSGHDHVYERFKPQNGIYYFVEGNSGELRSHDLRSSGEMSKGFDTDRAFMLVEIAGDQFYFQAVSRTGETVDSGMLPKQQAGVGSLSPANLQPSQSKQTLPTGQLRFEAGAIQGRFTRTADHNRAASF